MSSDLGICENPKRIDVTIYEKRDCSHCAIITHEDGTKERLEASWPQIEGVPTERTPLSVTLMVTVADALRRKELEKEKADAAK